MALRVCCIGAHPDDCEGSVGGTAALWRRRGDQVAFVSVTDGRRGHYLPEYLEDPGKLVKIRMREARQAADPVGIDVDCLMIPDGEVYVDRSSTEAMVRLIRRWQPDLVLTNRPNDYHRDHRYVAQLVLDASYMLTVPFFCPDQPALDAMPTIAYWQDGFTEGGEFRADVAVPIDAVAEDKRRMMVAFESQYFEWLPYNADPAAMSATGRISAERRLEIEANLLEGSRRTAKRFRQLLPQGTQFAEAFQVSEYGSAPPSDRAILFPAV